MRIKSFSTNQFAGISNKEIIFSDGMNVILGDNEAGKSTIISAMYYALNMHIKIDKRSDKGFVETVFPTSGENIVDAMVTVQTSEDEFEVKKEWYISESSNGKSTIKADITFKPQKSRGLKEAQAEKALKDLLKYGPGVYNNLTQTSHIKSGYKALINAG